MILKDLIVNNKENIDKVLEKLIECYPDFEQFYRKNILGLYNKLAYMPVNTDTENMIITLRQKDEDEERWIDVYGYVKDKEDEETYALELTDWCDWLGYEVEPATLNNFGEVAVIAHCLSEMTFFGDEENMKVERKNLNDLCDNLDLDSMKSYDSVEELLKDLGLGEDD
jgi:hypothetical protein